ncbi:hypothetical protein LB505_004950 [Fusarium chuoi]|nr:hypothetical protein LB505_004950 [Fusarium chuoi]
MDTFSADALVQWASSIGQASAVAFRNGVGAASMSGTFGRPGIAICFLTQPKELPLTTLSLSMNGRSLSYFQDTMSCSVPRLIIEMKEVRANVAMLVFPASMSKQM